jgi:hypothetical protein
MTLSCLCGQVHVTVQTRPEYVNERNCTLCSKTGARWGYFPFGSEHRDLCGVELRYPDGQAWSGSGGFDYIREPRIIS